MPAEILAQTLNAPYSKSVKCYFKAHPDEYLEIHCGPRAFRQAAWDDEDYLKKGGKPSLYLPHPGDYGEYWWPVKHLTILLYWAYDDQTLLQNEFCNHLAKVCRANCVWTSVEGVETKFQDTRRLM